MCTKSTLKVQFDLTLQQAGLDDSLDALMACGGGTISAPTIRQVVTFPLSGKL